MRDRGCAMRLRFGSPFAHVDAQVARAFAHVAQRERVSRPARALRFAGPLATTSEEDEMDRTAKVIVVALGVSLVSATTVGCGGTASYVRRGSYSGELALTGSAIDSHYAAETAMLEHCQGRVRRVEGEEAMTLSVRDPREDAAKVDGPVAADAEHVHYVCVSRAPAGH